MLKVDVNLLQEAHYQLRRQLMRLNAVIDGVNEVSRRLSACGSAFQRQEASIINKAAELRRYADFLQALCRGTNELAELYARCENQLRDVGFSVRGAPFRAGIQGGAPFIEPEVFDAALEKWIGPLLSDES